MYKQLRDVTNNLLFYPSSTPYLAKENGVYKVLYGVYMILMEKIRVGLRVNLKFLGKIRVGSDKAKLPRPF